MWSQNSLDETKNHLFINKCIEFSFVVVGGTNVEQKFVGREQVVKSSCKVTA